MTPMSTESITIVSIYPALLGTYGDAGNVVALRHRAALHGLRARVIEVSPGERIPASGDLYVLGGGEDSAQTAAARGIREDGNLMAAAESGAAVLAILSTTRINPALTILAGGVAGYFLLG